MLEDPSVKINQEAENEQLDREFSYEMNESKETLKKQGKEEIVEKYKDFFKNLNSQNYQIKPTLLQKK